jgi:hypothetical protein
VAIKLMFTRPPIDETTGRPALDEQQKPYPYEQASSVYEPQMHDRISVRVSTRREKGTIVRAVTDMANALGIEWEIMTDDDRVGYLGDQVDELQARIHQNDDPVPKVERSDDDRLTPAQRNPLIEAAAPPNSSGPHPHGDIINPEAATNADGAKVETSDDTITAPQLQGQ